MAKYELEIWADSFHEGEWAAIQISKFFQAKSVNYCHGFIPIWELQFDNGDILDIVIYGSYHSWKTLPNKINILLNFGKPDFILYDRSKDKILIAVEETAAVPTGNQALQRCERIFGSAFSGIPFIYLIGEYGVHKDGHIRRTSIWPTLLGLKLSLQFKTPSFSLHYSDLDNPEDYNVGGGLGLLFEYTFLTIKNYFSLITKTETKRLEKIAAEIITKMCDFIISQWSSITNFLPSLAQFKDKEFSKSLSDKILNKPSKLNTDDFLNWPLTNKRLIDQIAKEITLGYIKKDSFLLNLDACVSSKKGYVLSQGAGSKPQKLSAIKNWIAFHKELAHGAGLKYECDIKEFPPSPGGFFHITTSKNITYLMDNVSHVRAAYKKVFKPLPAEVVRFISERFRDYPAFVYVCNSLKPGRMFGDPFVGQFATFASIFAYNCARIKKRITFVYLPHQTAALFFRDGKLIKNKGTFIYKEMADLIICNQGHIINIQSETLYS